MAKTVAFIIYPLVITGFVLFMAQAVPAGAQDSGYEGLIAPPPSEAPAAAPETATPAPDDAGYGGLLAPAPSTGGNGQAPIPQEPAGYGGLIPGYVQENSAASSPPPEKQQPQMSSTPGGTEPATPKTSDDLKNIAAIRAQDRNGNGIPDELEQVGKVSDKTAKTLGTPYERIENMLPTEYMAKQNIDQLMPGVRDNKIPPKVRAENARKAHQDLETLADGLRFKKLVPDKIYRDMGLPDSFIQEEKEGNEKALVRLNEALNELKKY
ncbi:MAG: hypothetical protein K8R48_02780 [Alphaproteobacteria bacterium]|nr:hypothetical protein [Alphaproteobacteria bacterium]